MKKAVYSFLLTFILIIAPVLAQIDDEYLLFAELVEAIESKNQGLLQYFVRQGANVNGGTSMGGFTPLGLAVRMGDRASVSFLLKNGALTQALDAHGLTPLHYAINAGQSEIFWNLLSQANEEDVIDGLRAPSPTGSTPLRLAASNHNTSIRKALRAFFKNLAFGFGNQGQVESLERIGSLLNELTLDALSGLLALDDHTEPLESSGNITPSSEEDVQNFLTSLLYLAASVEGASSAESLLSLVLGADVLEGLESPSAAPASSSADEPDVSAKLKSLVLLLVNLGADFETKDKQGNNLFHRAATVGNQANWSALASIEGIDHLVHQQNNAGLTPRQLLNGEEDPLAEDSSEDFYAGDSSNNLEQPFSNAPGDDDDELLNLAVLRLACIALSGAPFGGF